MAERIAGEWRRKTRVVTESALGASGLGPDDLGDALTGDPDMIALAAACEPQAPNSAPSASLRSATDPRRRGLSGFPACPPGLVVALERTVRGLPGGKFRLEVH
jgi:hypothetical protein